MSKRMRDILILVFLAVALIAVIVVVNNNVPVVTGGIADITNR